MKRNERPDVAGVFVRSRIGVPSQKGWVVIGQLTEASNTLGTASPPTPMLHSQETWRYVFCRRRLVGGKHATNRVP